MVKGTFALFVRQKEWTVIEALGIYLAGAAGTACIISFLLGNISIALFSLALLLVGKIVSHVISLGRRERFLYVLASPKSSWISRGAWGLLVLIVLGIIIIASYINLLPWPGNISMKLIWVISLVLSGFVVVYPGFMLASSKGIPLWNNGMMSIFLPVLEVISGIGLIFISTSFIAWPNLGNLELINIVSIVLGIAITILYFSMMRYMDDITSRSAQILLREEATFWIGIALGMILPLLTTSYMFLTSPSVVALTITGISQMVGIFLIISSLFGAATYRPWVHECSYIVIPHLKFPR